MSFISGSYSLLLLEGTAADDLIADMVENDLFGATMAIDLELTASTIVEHLMDPMDGAILLEFNLVV